MSFAQDIFVIWLTFAGLFGMLGFVVDGVYTAIIAVCLFIGGTIGMLIGVFQALWTAA